MEGAIMPRIFNARIHGPLPPTPQARLEDVLRALAKLKERGQRIGKLRFKPFINSIPLKQPGGTYRVDFERNRVRIQKLGSFRVLGLPQIPREGEPASALLVRKPSGYYLHVVVYLPRGEGKKEGDLPPVGLDFGVKHQLTLSNGVRFGYGIPTSRRVSQLQRRLSKKKRGSKNDEHTRRLLMREYERLRVARGTSKTSSFLFCVAIPRSCSRMTG